MSGRYLLCGNAVEARDEDFACGLCVGEMNGSRVSFMAMVGFETVANEI